MVSHPNRNKTPAIMKALRAVRDGLVTQVYDRTGNKFEGPEGINGRTYRRAREMQLIEDVPGHFGGVYTTRIKQRLTAAGRVAVEERGR